MRGQTPAFTSAIVASLLLAAGCTGGSTGDATITTDGATSSSEATTTEVAQPATSDTSDAPTTTEPTEPSTAVWVIDGATFDAVALELETGEELARVAGWGDALDDPDVELVQTLQTIELTDGWLWLDDCCEPAYGTTFAVDLRSVAERSAEIGPDATIADLASVTMGGLGPRISPDGALVAVALGDVGVVVADTETGASAVDLDTLRSVLSSPDGHELVLWKTLAWVAPRTLVVAAPFAEGTLVSFVDLTDPDAPVALTEPLALGGTLIDATTGLDGHVVALSEGEAGTEAIVIDATTGTEVSRFAVLPGTVGIDASGDGQRFLLVGEAGDLAIQTADGEIEAIDFGSVSAIDAAW